MGLIGMLFTWAALRFRGRYFAATVGGIVALALIGYFTSGHVKDRVDIAAKELLQAVQVGDLATAPGEWDPVSARLELWYASLLIFKDHPLLGVGRGNFVRAAGPYIKKGLLNPETANYGHVHNAYLEMLVSKGIFGLILLVALLFYPLVVFVRTRHESRDTAIVGAIVVVGFSLFSITDASTFIKNNYISLFVIYLSASFSWHLRKTRDQMA